jgi:hypothetical protein
VGKRRRKKKEKEIMRGKREVKEEGREKQEVGVGR